MEGITWGEGGSLCEVSLERTRISLNQGLLAWASCPWKTPKAGDLWEGGGVNFSFLVRHLTHFIRREHGVVSYPEGHELRLVSWIFSQLRDEGAVPPHT